MSEFQSIQPRQITKIILPILLIMVSPILGYFVSTSDNSTVFLQGTLFVILIPFALVVSVEWLIWASLVSVMLADTYIVPVSAIFYLRYAPIGLLAYHGLATLLSREGKAKNIPKFLVLPMSLFCTLAVFSTFYAISPTNTFQRSLSAVFAIIGFGITLPLIITTTENRKRSLHAFTLICAGFILLSLGAYFTNRPGAYLIQEGAFKRASGIFKNPNTLGIVAGFMVIPYYILFIDAKSSVRKVFWIFFLMCALGALFLSGSRGSALSVIAGLGSAVALKYRINFTRLLPIALVSVFIIGLIYLAVPNDYLFTVDDSARFLTWDIAIDIGMRSPYIGSGFSTDEIISQNERYVPDLYRFVAGGHNEYLRIFVALGIPGVSLFILALGILIVRGLRAIESLTERETSWMPGLVGIIILGSLYSVFEDGLLGFGGSAGLIFWYFAGILAAEIQQADLQQHAVEVD